MRWRVVAGISLGVNALLAIGVVVAARHRPARLVGAGGVTTVSNDSSVKPIVRRLPFSWSEIESPDYTAYIANLRDIHCPEQTIRDIIIADVNSMYARRMSTEVVTASQQWWRSDPDTNVVLAAQIRIRELELERRTLLGRLLGTNWELGDLVRLPRPSRPVLALDGEVLGTLTVEAKQGVQEISARLQERLQAYADAQNREGGEVDTAEVARMRQQARYELARVLSPLQLEEFLLRYSPNAAALRDEFGQLRFFNATKDEFQAIFRSTDAFDQRLELLGDSDDPNTVQARRSLLDQREAALKQALGKKRYDEYVLLHDPMYRDAVAAAEQAGTPEAVQTIYQINLAAAAEQERIRADTNLTTDQRNIQLKQLDVEQLMANTVATGGELPPEPAAATQPTKRTYTVRRGDNASVIGMIYGVPESAIRAANPGVNFNSLRPGDTITIPNNALSPITGPPLAPGLR